MATSMVHLRVTLLRTARRGDDVAEATDRLEGTLDTLDQNPPLEEILGVGGQRRPGLLPRRADRPGMRLPGPATPPDPVNAMLSYGYTLLVHDTVAALSGYGPRLQLSVFECQVRSQADLQAMRADLRALIDPLEDQVSIYPTTSQTFSQRYILGARTVEERSDYWIIRWSHPTSPPR